MKVSRYSAGLAVAAAITLASVAGCAHQPVQPGATGPATPAAGPASSPATAATPSASAPATGATRVVSARVAYPWQWPNDSQHPGQVTHAVAVPPVPELVKISVGSHPAAPGQPPFDRMSFTFVSAFPSYRFRYTDKLTADATGNVVPVRGLGVLKIVFTSAQAHTAGAQSSIVSQPARDIGYQRIVDYAQAGDFEGVLTYGIGITWPVPRSNPQIPVRAYELQTVSATGQHLYVIAFDISSASTA